MKRQNRSVLTPNAASDMKPPSLLCFSFRIPLLLFVVATIGAGCSSSPRPLSIKISPRDAAIKEATVPVYVKVEGASGEAYKLLNANEVDNYLADFATPSSSVKHRVLGNADWEIPATDPIWKEWLKGRKKASLVIVADVPKVLDPKTPGVRITLDPAAWKFLGKNQPVEVKVLPSGLDLDPKPEIY